MLDKTQIGWNSINDFIRETTSMAILLTSSPVVKIIKA